MARPVPMLLAALLLACGGRFLIGGLLAMLIRTQLALPDQEILSVNAYNQVFTMHGTVMMFLFAIPILEGGADTVRRSSVDERCWRSAARAGDEQSWPGRC